MIYTNDLNLEWEIGRIAHNPEEIKKKKETPPPTQT